MDTQLSSISVHAINACLLCGEWKSSCSIRFVVYCKYLLAIVLPFVTREKANFRLHQRDA